MARNLGNLSPGLLNVPIGMCILTFTFPDHRCALAAKAGKWLFGNGVVLFQDVCAWSAPWGEEEFSGFSFQSAGKVVGTQPNPSTEEGGDAKLRRSVFVSDETVCTCEIARAEFCITKKKSGDVTGR